MLADVTKHIKKIVQELKRWDEINIITHIDADGIAAGAIAKKMMEREGIESNIHFVKYLDKRIIEEAKDMEGLKWFTDLGSGSISKLGEIEYIVTDHHMPDIEKKVKTWRHFNPHLYGIDGGIEISGAGLVYLIASKLNKKNRDMVDLAIVGACGDLQDSFSCKLEGWNQEIVKEGVIENKIEIRKDVRLFGRQTKPIHKILQYANDPLLPGLTGKERACLSFLDNLGIEKKEGKKWRRWIDLHEWEKKRIVSALITRILSKGFGHSYASRLIGEVYELVNEEKGTELRDAKEYATLLNSTARYGYADVGLKICTGERGTMIEKAKKLLQNHRKHLVKGLQLIKEEGIREHGFIQYFHAGESIRDTVIGIVTGILLHSNYVKQGMPLVGFAEKENGEIKASARAHSLLKQRGVNLSRAMQRVANRLGGTGGGHEVAAGATIPKGKEEEFLYMLEKEIRNQLIL
ncbi:MAG: DHH family phosphoesterase [Thermoplasmata archaeon]|nr:MAG: DHH family phosphoesterase [Thermoplasmata archaeon]